MFGCAKKLNFFVIISLFVFFSFSCSAKNNSIQLKYGSDYFYYQGLRSLEKNDIKSAERFFNKTIKSGGIYTARRSAEELTKIGGIQKRLVACKNLYKKFPDEDSLLLYATQLFESEEFTSVITETEKIDLKTSSNDLIFLRLSAMQKKQDLRYEDSVYNWFILRPYSQVHYSFFKSNISTITNLDFKNILNFRTSVFIKSYIASYPQLQSIFSTIKENENLYFTSQIISDIGKTCLYGSSEWLKNAMMFDNFLQELNLPKEKECVFFAYFYAARLYEKDGNYYSRSKNRYISAMENANIPSQYDNAFWYLLNLNLGISTDKAIEALEIHCCKWNDSLYFEDFFDNLSVLLLSSHKWNDFYKVYTIIKDYADKSILAKYAYLSGRLIQENFANQITDLPKDKEVESLFLSVLDSGSDTYYKVLAIERLDLSNEQAEKALFSKRKDFEVQIDSDAENLLLGYASLGFPERIYSEWQKLDDSKITLGLDCLTNISSFLRDCSAQISENYYKSLRIASLAINKSSVELTRESLELAYPKNYSDFVVNSCSEFGIKESILYALIHSESYFKVDAKSSVGAIGLTQVMDVTGQDIANRLKIKTYDLTNPETNIRFGAYYLSNLTQRLDNSMLLSAFAYNSGIARVRRWLSNSKKEFCSTKNPPLDLFLETIPYAETREYGRKIVSSATMYSWLYYNSFPTESVREILRL